MEKTSTPFTYGGVKRIQSVCNYVGLGKSKIYELVAKGEFPRPIPLGTPKAKGFLVSELDQWLIAQASKRNSTEVKTHASKYGTGDAGHGHSCAQEEVL